MRKVFIFPRVTRLCMEKSIQELREERDMLAKKLAFEIDKVGKGELKIPKKNEQKN